MENKETIVLDLTDCKYLGELHLRIREAFDFPFWYGQNWDAFWDLLWSDCTADRVEVIGEGTMPKEFAEQLEIMHRILERMKNHCAKYGEIFEYEIMS